MANSYTNINDVKVMSDGVAALKKALTPLSVFTLDAGSDPMEKNEYVYVPLASARSGSAFSSTYESGDSTITGKGVQLSNHRFCSWHVTDVQGMKSSAKLFEMESVEAAYGLASDIQTLVLNVITTANFTGTSVTVTAANFGLDDVADIRSKATKTNGWREVEPGKLGALVLDGKYVEALNKDTTVINQAASGKDTLVSGVVGRIYGLDIYENNLIATSTPGTTQNLVGFAVQPGAIAVAVRPVRPGDDKTLAFADIAVDPDSGIAMSYRRWYNPASGTLWGTYTVLMGVVAVDPSRLIAIYSAE